MKQPTNKKNSHLRWYELGLATYAAVLGAVLGAIAVLLVSWWQSSDDPPSIFTQLASIRADAAREHRRPIVNRKIDLQALGRKSWLIVLRHDSLRPISKVSAAPISDEIRVYAPDDSGRLQLEFRFQPTPFDYLGAMRPLPPGGLQSRPNDGLPAMFSLDLVQDLDGDDQQELLGHYFAPGGSVLPIAITWNDDSESYEVSALLESQPHLRLLGKSKSIAAQQRISYARTVVLDDTQSSAEIRARPVQGYGLFRSRSGGTVILTSYIGHAPEYRKVHSIELAGISVDFQGPPLSIQCLLGQPTVVIHRLGSYELSRFSGFFGKVPLTLVRGGGGCG